MMANEAAAPRRILTVAEKRAIFAWQQKVQFGDNDGLLPTYKADNKALSMLKIAARGVYIEICVFQPNTPWSGIDTEWTQIPADQVERALQSVSRRYLHLTKDLEIGENVRKVLCSRQYLLHELERFREELRRQQRRKLTTLGRVNEEHATTGITARLDQLANNLHMSREIVFQKMMYGYELAEQVLQNWKDVRHSAEAHTTIGLE